MKRMLDLDTLVLAKGAHDPDHTFCMLEAAAYMAGEPWTDNPVCVSPAIGAFGRSWNDALSDEDRQMLKPYIVKILNTATGPADEERRAWLATDWLVRTFAPAWLDLAKLDEHAANLRVPPELTSDRLAESAMEIIRAAYSAAYSAARSAADSAAYSAARSAADSAAYSAARETLAPTVKLLQQSALDLLERMIAVGKVEAA